MEWHRPRKPSLVLVWKNVQTHTQTKMAAERMVYWFVIMAAVVFQSFLTKRGSSIEPFIANDTMTAGLCVLVGMQDFVFVRSIWMH